MKTLRRLLIFAALIASCMCLVSAGIVAALTARMPPPPPEPSLNPLEVVFWRVYLGVRTGDLDALTGRASEPVLYELVPGTGAGAIGAQLAELDIIADPELFRRYAAYVGVDSRMEAGTYWLRPGLTIRELADILTDSGYSDVTLRVTEGWRLEQIAAAIDALEGINATGSEFLAVTGPEAPPDPRFPFLLERPPGTSLEGYVFPDTYRISRSATALDIRGQMLANFDAKIAPLRPAIRQSEYDLHDVLTLASIVEREAIVEDERPLVAGVYLNRLSIGMRLQADPTIQYALGLSREAGNWWPDLTVADYQNVHSPYNTYIHDGLPPTPIANPGLASIEAVLSPADTPYFFFRAACEGDGRHLFAETFEEHQANACP